METMTLPYNPATFALPGSRREILPFTDTPVLVTPALPMPVSWEERLVRSMRHRAKALDPVALRNFDPGPGPDEETHAFKIGNTAFVSEDLYQRLLRAPLDRLPA